jgi:hypothetical protein
MRAAPCNATRAQYRLKDQLIRVVALHLVEVLILSLNFWEVEYDKTPLVCRAGDGSPKEAGGDDVLVRTGWTGGLG